jgi:hypothetical protein
MFSIHNLVFDWILVCKLNLTNQNRDFIRTLIDSIVDVNNNNATSK